MTMENQTHQFTIELETLGSPGHVPVDVLEQTLLNILRTELPTKMVAVGDQDATVFSVKVNVVVYETTYPTPRPEDL